VLLQISGNICLPENYEKLAEKVISVIKRETGEVCIILANRNVTRLQKQFLMEISLLLLKSD